MVIKSAPIKKEPEPDFQSQRDYFSAIVDTIREPLLVLDQSLKVISANHAFYKKFQVQPSCTEGVFVYNLGNGQWDIPALRKLLEEILPEKTVFNDFEVEHNFPDLGRRIMKLNARRIERNGPDDQILLVIEDITETHEAYEKLRLSEEKMRIMLEGMQNYAIFMLNEEGIISSWVAGAERLLGYCEDEIKGKSISIVFTPEDRETGQHEEEMRLAREKGCTVNERWHLKKDGSRFYGSGYLSRHFNAGGDPVGYVKIFQDKTEQKRIREALERSNRDLEQFANTASHDLQEPLAIIMMYLDLALSSHIDSMNPEAVEWIRTARDGAGRASGIIRKLLEYARLSSPGKSIRPVDMNALLGRALANLKLSVEKSGTEITHESLPVVCVDSLQMVQVLQNLVSNAVKYRSGEPVKIHIAANWSDHHWLFSVRDNGRGIEEEYHEKIFDLFSRSPGRDDQTGTGVGLAVCKKVIEQHGGRIWVESRPGEGAVFYFTLPAHKPEVDFSRKNP